MAIVDDALKFCSTFEAEVLLEMMLRYWRHPLAAEADFRNEFLEKSTEVLARAQTGTCFLEDVPCSHMNFVAAIWYVEWAAIEMETKEISEDEKRIRMEWLNQIRSSLPSCFVDQNKLW